MILAISGIRRSGNHAISMWIINHFNSTKFYSDYTFPKYRETTPHDKEPPEVHYFEKYVKTNEMLLQLGSPHSTIHSDNAKFMCDNTLYGLENYYPHEIQKFNDLNFDKKILVIRDPINNLSSIIKNEVPIINLRHYSKIWKSYALEFMNDNKEFVKIIYEKWFSDYKYRREIEKELGIGINDDGLNRIHNAGGGSSFDYISKQGNAQSMSINDRWMHCKTNNRYLKTLNDKELLEMRYEIYGELPNLLARRFSI